jgi:hypothetical protein
MPAFDAYARKAALAEDLRTDLYANYLQARIRSVRGGAGTASVPAVGIYDRTDTGRVVARKMLAAVETGYTFYVAPHMESLVTAAAESLPEDDVIVPGDLPTPQGFVWIPGGITLLDVRGRVLKYNAALWTTFGGQVFVWWLTDKYDDADMTNHEIRRTAPKGYWETFPQLTPNGEGRALFGQPMPKHLGQTKVIPPEYRQKMTWDDNQGLVFWSEYGMGSEEMREWLTPTIGPDAPFRWLLACWRLMQQSVTRLDDVEMPRQLRKLGRRAGLPSDYVTVIDLRSAPSRGDGEPGVEWSHRWLVRGHWRKQRCKEDGEWTTKTIWIHPHVKGPEGKPLLIRDHVYNLTR